MRNLNASELSEINGSGGIRDAVVGWIVGKVLDYESDHIAGQMEAYGQYYMATGGLAAYGY